MCNPVAIANTIKEVTNRTQPSRSLLEASLDPLVTISSDGKISDANKATEQLTEVPRAQLIGSVFSEYFTEPEKARKSYEEVLSKGFVRDHPLAIRGKSGRVTDVLYNATVYLDEGGRVQGVIVEVRDITERKRVPGKLLALHSLAQQLESTKTVDEVIKHTLDAMEFTLGFSSADFEFVDEERRCLLVTGKRGAKPFSFSKLPLDGPGVTVKAANTRKTIRLPDTRIEKEYVDDEGRAGKEASPTKLSELAVPVMMNDKVVAVLNVESTRLSAFTDEDQSLLETLAAHVSSVLKRLKQDEGLRKSEERFRNLFNRVPVGAYISTHDGRFVDVNPAFVKMFGYSSRQEMLGIADIKKELYFSPDERGSHVLDTGKEEVETYRMRRKDGSEIWVEDHGHYIHDEQGRLVYHEGVLADVTERKRLERELKQHSTHLERLVNERSSELAESEAQYRRLFESSPIPLLEEDFSQVKKYLDDLQTRGVREFRGHFTEHPEDLSNCAAMVKVLRVNEAALKLYGAKSADEMRVELGRVLAPGFHARLREELVALAEGKTHFQSEFDNKTLTGDIKHVSLVLNIIPGYEDTLTKVLVSIVDLTEHKRMEERLQQAERLAAVGETAAMVGHDLRNPLQGIAGAAYLLKQGSLSTEKRNEMIKLIEQNVDYSDGIVRDLTEYAAEIHLELVKATPKSIITGALRGVRIPARIALQDLTEAHPCIRIDPDRMKRIIINLVENAVDAMPQGGTLTIASKELDGTVEITFSDTGVGMPEKAMQNLWKPLQTTKAKGMGMGLAICKRIVDAHGGTISVKSKIGEGTTIIMTLPIERST
jgi:PAS domain S-box-containing protein